QGVFLPGQGRGRLPRGRGRRGADPVPAAVPAHHGRAAGTGCRRRGRGVETGAVAMTNHTQGLPVLAASTNDSAAEGSAALVTDVRRGALWTGASTMLLRISNIAL